MKVKESLDSKEWGSVTMSELREYARKARKDVARFKRKYRKTRGNYYGQL